MNNANNFNKEHITFSYSQGGTNIDISLSAESDMYEVIQHFETFIRAIGYPINNKYLQISEDEEWRTLLDNKF